MERTIDAATLDRVAKSRRFDARTLEIAQRIFVNGERAASLAREYGLHPLTVYRIVRNVRAASQAEWLPPGWIKITIAGPEPMMREFERAAREAQRAWRKAQGRGAAAFGAAAPATRTRRKKAPRKKA